MSSSTNLYASLGYVGTNTLSGFWGYIVLVVGIIFGFFIIEMIVDYLIEMHQIQRNKTDLTQSVPQTPFSKAETEEYAYKEKLYELSQREKV